VGAETSGGNRQAPFRVGAVGRLHAAGEVDQADHPRVLEGAHGQGVPAPEALTGDHHLARVDGRHGGQEIDDDADILRVIDADGLQVAAVAPELPTRAGESPHHGKGDRVAPGKEIVRRRGRAIAWVEPGGLAPVGAMVHDREREGTGALRGQQGHLQLGEAQKPAGHAEHLFIERDIEGRLGLLARTGCTGQPRTGERKPRHKNQDGKPFGHHLLSGTNTKHHTSGGFTLNGTGRSTLIPLPNKKKGHVRGRGLF